MGAAEGPVPGTDQRRAGWGPRADLALRVVQLLAAGWLLLTPLTLPGAEGLVEVKDVAAGAVLLAVTVAATLSRRAARLEGAACLVLGGLLVLAAVLVEFGPGAEAVAAQWSEVVVGVLLICLAAARSP